MTFFCTRLTGKLKQDVSFKKLGFKEIGVNQRGVVEGYIKKHRPFVSDFFEHGEREVVETV